MHRLALVSLSLGLRHEVVSFLTAPELLDARLKAVLLGVPKRRPSALAQIGVMFPWPCRDFVSPRDGAIAAGVFASGGTSIGSSSVRKRRAVRAVCRESACRRRSAPELVLRLTDVVAGQTYRRQDVHDPRQRCVPVSSLLSSLQLGRQAPRAADASDPLGVLSRSRPIRADSTDGLNRSCSTPRDLVLLRAVGTSAINGPSWESLGNQHAPEPPDSSQPSEQPTLLTCANTTRSDHYDSPMSIRSPIGPTGWRPRQDKECPELRCCLTVRLLDEVGVDPQRGRRVSVSESPAYCANRHSRG